MVVKSDPLPALYEADEVAWLDETTRRLREGRVEELDIDHLLKLLDDMGKSERRKVRSRLKVLMAHTLKWQYQPNQRTHSWIVTLEHQRQKLLELLEDSGTLRNFATDCLVDAYALAVRLAAKETELPTATFPAECPYTLDQLLDEDGPAGNPS